MKGMNKPKRCIMMSYNNNNKLEKYQKHKNKTDNIHGYTNGSSRNKKNKSINIDESSSKISYNNNNIIITMKITKFEIVIMTILLIVVAIIIIITKRITLIIIVTKIVPRMKKQQWR